VRYLIFLILFFLSTYSQAVTVAILDSGIDFEHELVKSHQFLNLDETLSGIDDDLNGYIDDYSGWNFISMDSIGHKKEGFPSFEEDFYRYYEVRKKRSLQSSTSEEDSWYNERKKDEEFQVKRKLFRRYIHGTHVSGLAIGQGLKQVLKRTTLPNDFSAPKLLNITYLGDAEKGPAVEPEFSPLYSGSHLQKTQHVTKFLKTYLQWQKLKLELAVSYASQFAHVLNASFGISHDSAGKMVKKWWDHQFNEALNSQELEDLQNSFRLGLISITKEVVDSYPQLVFVFSAGNGKDDTTTQSHYPSGVTCDHCLTVGASLGTQERAYFSNFGSTSVSLFAPGVAMISSVPDGRYLPVNGTSQAAPQVAFAAANILKQAWDLGLFINTAMVKEILMTSVDKVDTLKNDCQSGGILNPLRAIYLTKLLRKYSPNEASTLAYKRVPNQIFLPKLTTLEDSSPSRQESDPLSK
jgi:cell wall-associated protease